MSVGIAWIDLEQKNSDYNVNQSLGKHHNMLWQENTQTWKTLTRRKRVDSPSCWLAPTITNYELKKILVLVEDGLRRNS